VTFPCMFEVGLHTCTEGLVLDDYGVLGAVFTPDRGEPGARYLVYGAAPAGSTEKHEDRVIVDKELFVPPGFPATAYDLIDLPDGQYQVIGQPADYGDGPFGFQPGSVLHLKKVTG